jgi:hypothetical protein
LLEEALTGYIPEDSRYNEEAEKMKKKISELVSPAPKPPSTKLLTSGIDLILHLELSIEERIRR